jgi:hypothetical protein
MIVDALREERITFVDKHPAPVVLNAFLHHAGGF